MEARFCESSGDITLIISKDELEKIKRRNGYAQILEVSSGNFTFHLINSQSSAEFKVGEPVSGNNHYWLGINDAAYNALMEQGQIGTRYGALSSKAHIEIAGRNQQV